MAIVCGLYGSIVFKPRIKRMTTDTHRKKKRKKRRILPRKDTNEHEKKRGEESTNYAK